MASNIGEAIQSHVVKATKVIEDQVDAEIERLDKMDDDELEILHQRRLNHMKKLASQKQDWLAVGHGQYSEVADEKEFFAECKKSVRVVCHFYRDSTFRCKIVDKHMEILARNHLETKFIKINAEKCPFLVERLRIKMLPTLCIAKDGKTVDYIVGFDQLGGIDEFPTEMLEWRLGVADVINYSGDLKNPPSLDGLRKSKSLLGEQKKNIIRGRDEDDSSDENDW